MSARAVPDRADPWETRQPFKVECLECQIEWAWGYDWRKCESAAEQHNAEMHAAEVRSTDTTNGTKETK